MLNNEEKRALEIYTFLIISKIRNNNTKALQHINYFFKSMAFFQNYNADFLYKTCIYNLERIDLLPKPIEIALIFTINSTKLKFVKQNIKKIYPKPIRDSLIRKNYFSEHPIGLYPKIRIPDFHENLLIFYNNFSIISKTLPIIGEKK